jgi:hypothetical protein
MPTLVDTTQPANTSSLCFVVMPYGTKPLNDGSGRTFDFEKVYRAIIERAVRGAGLDPRRADHEKTSGVIHIDMFKSLRDNAIVLADLSLENPNVFYELGVRHVMSSKGTVLICREGSTLPFDVRLSRVIFYRYDGVSLDWEEVERIVPVVKAALLEAQRGQPDSPVHALLERVMPESTQTAPSQQQVAWSSGRRENLEPFQEMVAAYWAGKKTPLAKLKKTYITSPFGCGALAHYCLRKRTLNSGEARNLTRDLYDFEQYDLVNRIFSKLEAKGVKLRSWELLRYGSSLSEADPSPRGARGGLKYTQRALDEVEARTRGGEATPEDTVSAFHCSMNLSGFHFWLWTIEHSTDDLDRAIRSMETALGYARTAEEQGTAMPPGPLAHAHIKQMLMLRSKEGQPDRPDEEGHGEAVLGLGVTRSPASSAEERMSASYLRWYQAIVLADRGEGQRSFYLALSNARDDAHIMDQPNCYQVARRQYTHLRRFIEQYSHILRNVDDIARISQVLQQFQQSPV